MRGKVAKHIRELVKEGLEGQDLPAVKHGARKIKTVKGDRYQFVIHPQCVRYHVKELKRFVKHIIHGGNAPQPKPVKNVGFGSRRKARNQQIRASIPKFTEQGEIIHAV